MYIMAIDFLYPQYEVVRNPARCIACRVCERQCANEVHRLRRKAKRDACGRKPQCVNCHRCVSLCPTRALKIVKSDNTFKENANWPAQTITEVYRQARSGRRAALFHGQPEASARSTGISSSSTLRR